MTNTLVCQECVDDGMISFKYKDHIKQVVANYAIYACHCSNGHTFLHSEPIDN